MENFEELLQKELDKLPYTKHLDDGQYNDGQVAGFENGARWALSLFAVIGTLPLYKVDGLLKALNDIKDWDDDLEDEWEDQGYRAKAALNEWAS